MLNVKMKPYHHMNYLAMCDATYPEDVRQVPELHAQRLWQRPVGQVFEGHQDRSVLPEAGETAHVSNGWYNGGACKHSIMVVHTRTCTACLTV